MSAQRGPPSEPEDSNEPSRSRLRARIRMLRQSQLGEALAERKASQVEDEPAAPSSREISPELVLVDPDLAAWLRERC